MSERGGDPYGPAVAGAAIVPLRLVERWEAAYRRYGQASTRAARSQPGDRQAARAVASTSAQVALHWRDIARTEGLVWWMLAALRAAADAFEAQARDWQARADYAAGSPPSPVDRPPVTGPPTNHG